MSNKEYDNVNSPAHYTGGKIECIEAIEEAVKDLKGIEAFAIGNAIKYLWRFDKKNGVEDLQKAHWYIFLVIKLREKSTQHFDERV